MICYKWIVCNIHAVLAGSQFKQYPMQAVDSKAHCSVNRLGMVASSSKDRVCICAQWHCVWKPNQILLGRWSTDYTSVWSFYSCLFTHVHVLSTVKKKKKKGLVLLMLSGTAVIRHPLVSDAFVPLVRLITSARVQGHPYTHCRDAANVPHQFLHFKGV